jgi:hypothetical protein
VDSHIKDVRLTPEIDKMQVDDELDDLHSSQVLFPLKNIEYYASLSVRARIIAYEILTHIFAPPAVA